MLSLYGFGVHGLGYAVFDPDQLPIFELSFEGDRSGLTALRLAAGLNYSPCRFEFDQGAKRVRQIFTANGTFTWPAGVTECVAYCWGGGGGAGASASGEGGGGGGGFVRKTVTKTHSTLDIVVGSAVAVNTTGNPTTIKQNGVDVCAGDGGAKGNARTGGAGGIGIGGVGSIETTGGSGGTSTGAGNDGGGGGGGSAGAGGNGGNGGANTPAGGPTGGVAGTAGAGTPGGAAGGAGGDDNLNGADGSIPGGGGGGGGAAGNGGGGARGEVWIEYDLPASMLLMGVG